ncbi:unnamed protein product [Prunus armeniaca]
MAFYSSFIVVVLTSCRWQCWHLQSILLYFAKHFCVWKHRVPVKHRAPQLYWNTVLPYTKMPKAISDLILRPAEFTDGSTEENNSLHYELHISENGGPTRIYNPAMQRHIPATQPIPFSLNKLTEIFKLFSVVEQGSLEANALKETIELCERPGNKGEEKYCTTSLESMIDFSTSKLGTRNVQAVSTELLEKGVIKSLRKYTVLPRVKKLGFDEAVSCHEQRYPFPVFYCHSTKQTASYVMSMKDADGEKVKAVAMCHIDTSEWNPRHSAFQVLKVKPGTVIEI